MGLSSCWFCRIPAISSGTHTFLPVLGRAVWVGRLAGVVGWGGWSVDLGGFCCFGFGECGRERCDDLVVAQEKRLFVQAFSSHPCGDLVVALAGVAGSARRHDVGQRVPPPSGNSEHTILLESGGVDAAIGASAPRGLEGLPLRRGEVVDDAGYPARSPAGIGRLATSVDGHSRKDTCGR